MDGWMQIDEVRACNCVKKWIAGIEQVDRVVVKLEKMRLNSLGKKIFDSLRLGIRCSPILKI